MVPSEPRKKPPATPLGIDPETLRLVAQCLNHYATPHRQIINTAERFPDLYVNSLCDLFLLFLMCSIIFLTAHHISGSFSVSHNSPFYETGCVRVQNCACNAYMLDSGYIEQVILYRLLRDSVLRSPFLSVSAGLSWLDFDHVSWVRYRTAFTHTKGIAE
jgi:hypothetical protein